MSQPRQTLRRRLGLRAWDVTLFWIGFFLTTAMVSNIPGTQGTDGVTDLAVVLWMVQVAAWVTVLFRRSRPWLVLWSGLGLAVLGSEYLLFLIGVLHVLLGTSGRRRLQVAGGAAGVVLLFATREALTGWGGFLLDMNQGDAAFTHGLRAAIAVISLGATFGTAAVTASRRTAAVATGRAEAEHARAADLGDQVARQAEREEIAREIHDGLTNRLALLAMMGGNVERAVDSSDPRAVELARQLKEQSREALGDLRGLVQGLRASPSEPPAPRGTMREVGRLIADAQAAGAVVHATVLLEGMTEAPAMLDAAVHRMVQESVTNAVKHAPGAPISLFLEASPDSGVRLRVTNPLVRGIDLAVGRGSGTGLMGIGERASALHGTAWTGAHRDEFVVDVSLPWSTAELSDPRPTVGP